MKKLLNNKKLIGIITIVLSSILIILSIIFLVKSFNIYKDEWGCDISIDNDYLVILIASISLLIYGIYMLYSHISNKYDYNIAFGSLFVCNILLAFYPLGSFFKALAKKEKYIDCQWYLYIGLFGLILFVLLTVKYFKRKKK